MTDTTEQTEAQKRRAAYSAAETRLREAHLDEFKTLVMEEASNRGVTYVFRKTEVERAAEQLRQLLTDHPELREQIATESVPGS